jgi:hypothetical protein
MRAPGAGRRPLRVAQRPQGARGWRRPLPGVLDGRRDVLPQGPQGRMLHLACHREPIALQGEPPPHPVGVRQRVELLAGRRPASDPSGDEPPPVPHELAAGDRVGLAPRPEIGANTPDAERRGPCARGSGRYLL